MQIKLTPSKKKVLSLHKQLILNDNRQVQKLKTVRSTHISGQQLTQSTTQSSCNENKIERKENQKFSSIKLSILLMNQKKENQLQYNTFQEFFKQNYFNLDKKENLKKSMTFRPKSYCQNQIQPIKNQKIKQNTYYMSNLLKYSKVWNNQYNEYFSIIYKQHFDKIQKPDIGQLKKVYLRESNLKTLVLDLDETLIHCIRDENIPYDFKIRIESDNFDLGINVRPGAYEFLKDLSKLFEIVIFTAGNSEYANPILDILDPKRKYISKRLFRQNCYETEDGLFIKDLRILNRNIKNIVLVDNQAYSFCFQLSNGVPIIPFYDNKEDRELNHLKEYLKTLIYKDVQLTNIKTFKLWQYVNINKAEDVLSNLY